MILNNTIVFHWSAVAYCKLWYRDEFDVVRKKRKPAVETAYGEPIPDELYPLACARGLIDKWIPVVKVQLRNSHSLMYEGTRALGIWKEWMKRCYKRQ